MLSTGHILRAGARSTLHGEWFVAMFFLWAANANGGDWPFLRGPVFDGSAPGERISEFWTAGETPVLWDRYLGQGYSSITVAGERGYTLYQSTFHQFLLCFDVRTGRTIWEFPFDAPYEQLGIYPGPRSTPTLEDGRILFVSPDAVLHCVDAETGASMWSVNLEARFQGKGTEFGYSASPVVVGTHVIVPVGGAGAAVVAFDLSTGDVRWQSGSQPASYASTTPISLNGKTLIVSALRNHLVIHDPETGRLLWETRISDGYDEHSISPLYEEPVLVLSAPFRAGATAYTLSLTWTNAEDSSTWSLESSHRWYSKEFSNDVLGSAIVDGAIYGFDLRDQQAKAHRPSRGTFRCLDVSTGQTLWSSDRPGHSNVLPVDGKLLLFNDKGELVVIRADRTRYEELGRSPVFADEVCWTFPALSDGRVFLRTQSRMAAVEVGQPSVGNTIAEKGTTPSRTPPRRSWSRFRLGQLLGGEREHPFMRPASDELWTWFLFTLGLVWVPASLISAIRRRRLQKGNIESAIVKPIVENADGRPTDLRSPTARHDLIEPALWVGLGLAATPVVNGLREDFVFTWPAALFGGLQCAVAGNDVANRGIRRACDCGFLLLCVFYFLALRSQSLPHEWVFLLGLVPAAPMAWLWHRGRQHGWPPVATSSLTLLGISVMFLSAPLWEMMQEAWTGGTAL